MISILMLLYFKFLNNNEADISNLILSGIADTVLTQVLIVILAIKFGLFR